MRCLSAASENHASDVRADSPGTLPVEATSKEVKAACKGGGLGGGFRGWHKGGPAARRRDCPPGDAALEREALLVGQKQ
eukprot:jgi/Tetstr1/449737/TSEL_036804.t1